MLGLKKKEDAFFDLFSESAAKTVVVGEAFVDLVQR